MDYLSIIQLAIQYGPLVKQIIDEATSNHDISTKVTSLAPTIGNVIADVGAKLFPHSTKDLQMVGGAIAAFDPNYAKWLQKSLNQMLALNPPLVVDGIYGEKTRDAVVKLQTKLGLTQIDGIAGKITQAAINAALQTVTKAA